MTEPISLLVFPYLLVIYILGIVIFYSKQLYGTVTNQATYARCCMVFQSLLLLQSP